MTIDQGSGTRIEASSRIRGRVRPGIRRVLTAVAAGTLALASLAPAALAVDKLTVTTPYPAIVVAPGATVSFNVSISTPTPDRVALTLTGAPASWKATLHGGGFVIDAVETAGNNATGDTQATSIRVDMTVPADAKGTTTMTLTGTGSDTGFALLPLEVRVDPNATGALTIKNDIPALRGPSTQSFNFSLTLTNDTTEDQTYSATGAGPTGWTVNTTLTGQSQAASATVKAGSSAGITVAVTPPADVAAGTYKMQVATSVGGQTLVNDLQVEITGTYTMTMDTSDSRLNGHGSAGSTSPLAIVLTNTGTADITNVTLTGTGPGKWDITFDQPTVATIAAGQSVTVNAQIKPSGDAIAGDYTVTLSASGDASAKDSIQIRYTVETSIIWGAVGVALIIAVGAGVWWVFQRYGRR
ncbi:MAG: NEW3 domain-containing protein [Chloroflexota bacterium]